MNQVSGLPIPGTTPRAKRTRKALFRAAERVFGSKGYDNASISEITRAAGVGQGTFYLHFPDKKAVFLGLVEELGRELRATLREAAEGCETRMEMERAGLAAFFRFVADRPDLYRILRQAEFVDPEAHRAYYERLAGSYARGLERAMEEGEVRRMDTERLAWSLMGIADFLGMRFVLWAPNAEVDVDRLTDAAMDLLNAGMAPARPETDREGGKA